jgi:phosphatidylserine decarboxylase
VRNINITDDAVVSPADGKIVVIEKVVEDEFFNDERIQVSIFMSPLNVHLNRVPFDGTVDYYKYHPGKYLVAFHPKSSKLNERNSCVIRDKKGRQVLMRQIAGAVARRIRFYLHEGQQVRQGEELGFIKFGSRMDLFLPLNTEIAVEMGQPVKAGMDVIARLK